ncbi:MAG: hypothetical protein WBC77_04465, partial [Candidatus Zixiibacteriota bacterium]
GEPFNFVQDKRSRTTRDGSEGEFLVGGQRYFFTPRRYVYLQRHCEPEGRGNLLMGLLRCARNDVSVSLPRLGAGLGRGIAASGGDGFSLPLGRETE